MRDTVNNPIVLATLGTWIALELALRIRDVASGRGGTAQDRGTRWLIALAIGVTIVASARIAAELRHDHALWLPGKGGDPLLIAGLVLMWAGLLVRLGAVIALGGAFRTTVEVDEDQPLIDRGPYRLVRHPSYSGLLLIITGYGVASGTWPSLLIAIVIPLAVLIRRIKVEEEALLSGMGSSYERYQRRTKRLLPGVW